MRNPPTAGATGCFMSASKALFGFSTVISFFSSGLGAGGCGVGAGAGAGGGGGGGAGGFGAGGAGCGRVGPTGRIGPSGRFPAVVGPWGWGRPFAGSIHAR